MVANAARIRILYVMPGLGMGGTERVVCNCATRLDAKSFETSVAVLYDGDMRRQFDARRIPIYNLREGIRSPLAAGRVLATRVRLRRIARGIDIVHTHHLDLLFYAALAAAPRRRWKWVHTEHISPDIGNLYPPWLLRLGRYLLRLPDALVGVASPVTDYYRNAMGSASARTFTIYNGIDLNEFKPCSDRLRRRAELGLPPDAWAIGTVGRLRPQKNHALLLRAFAKLLAPIPAARLVLVGDGELEDSLRALAGELRVLDRVTFLGIRHDVPEVLRCFDVYCLPSFFEGMPLSLLEAMASELPVVASDVVGIHEFVQDANAGLLFRSNDLDALCDALCTLRLDPAHARRLARNGFDWVVRNGSVESMVSRHAALYRSLSSTAPTARTAP